MSRLKFSVYGNCQNHPLSLILRCSTEFSSIYEELPIKSIHLLSPDEDEGVQETVRNLDLFIYQPVEANYRGNFRKLGTKFLLGYMKNDATAISIPVAYFTGYNPETIYLRDNNGGVVTGHFSDYHDLNILKAYHHGLDWQECISYIQMNEIYPLEFLKTILSNNLAELRKRESVIDIKVSDFIEKNWRQQRL